MKNVFALALTMLFFSCKKNPTPADSYVRGSVGFPTHSLSVYNIPSAGAKYLLVFDTGLGDYSKLWIDSKIPDSFSRNQEVLLYDRAGYNTSTTAPAPRDVTKMRSDLEKVIATYSRGRKVILVAHSLGGYVIRDYAIKNPDKVAALMFVDPSHELYNGLIDQATEDLIYEAFKTRYGAGFGGTMEARELLEDAQYMSALPNLPDVPVSVLTSMKLDPAQGQDAADRQLWFTAHESLGTGLTEFTHYTTTVSGHYIMKTEPGFIVSKLKSLIAKLP
ncbi:MAG: alpha/beta fold hydrolase [Ferruginibacter sp.]